MERKRNQGVQEQFLTEINTERVWLGGNGGGLEPKQKHCGGSDVLAEVAGPRQPTIGEQVGGKTDDEQVQVSNDQKCSLFLKLKSSIWLSFIDN